MVIECSSCHTRFKLADDKVKVSGTKVRCTKCKEVFTVYPEAPAPIVETAPLAEPQQDVAEDLFFSKTETAPGTTAPTLPTDFPSAEEDDWNQNTASDQFADGFPNETGFSDLDAISFDNIEAPVFSVTGPKETNLEFNDDTAFSFSDLTQHTDKEQAFDEVERENDHLSIFDAGSDSFPETVENTGATPPPPALKDLTPTHALPSDEFTFSGTENMGDFSWEESASFSDENAIFEKKEEEESSAQDTDFDFSSFSFDEVENPPLKENKDEVPLYEPSASIELANDSEPLPTGIESRVPHLELTTAALADDFHEIPQRPTRQLRARSRKKGKGSSRKGVKYITLSLIVLAAIFGFMNREQIQREYKNFVSGFIEKQTQTTVSGSIGLVKLSASYVLNELEGELFVIHGEAINEFKGLRSSILVRGTIYDDNGAPVQTQSAYCGNPLPDSKLKKLNFNDIRNIMSNELGENLINLNISPGKGIPFTIVFNKAPKNIKEFTVEVLESKTGSK